MVVMLFLQPLLCVLAFLFPYAIPALGCPSGCRCYSLTVECGSMGLQEVPPHAPPTTQTFFLQDNSIAQIRQQDLWGLGQLHYLYLQNNSISALEPGAFRSLGRLLELALNGNRIHLLTAQIFQGLEHLRILYLAGNQITRLHDHTFHSLQRLQELHLQENSVEAVGEQALVGLSSLALLDLSRNNLHTLHQASLRPLLSLQVLRVTENPWRCDCALHWLRSWLGQEGQRLLSWAGRRLRCAAPPRLSQRSLAEVPGNSLVCIPPALRLEPRSLALRPGSALRVACLASGYPQPQVSWRRAEGGAEPGRGGERFEPDAGGGMLLLSNVTAEHAGPYECEARNAGGVARVTFHLSVNASSRSPSSARRWRGRLSPPGGLVSRQPLRAPGMGFRALGPAPQTAIAAGIALLALTALLLLALICGRHRRLKKGPEEDEEEEEEGRALYVNDYSDGPVPSAQLEERREGREMYVLVDPLPASGQQGAPSRALSPAEPPQSRAEGDGGEAEPAETLFLNQGLLFDSQVAYEIHC